MFNLIIYLFCLNWGLYRIVGQKPQYKPNREFGVSLQPYWLCVVRWQIAQIGTLLFKQW